MMAGFPAALALWRICFCSHPQVAAGQHDAVGGLEDGVDVVQGLGLLDLGDERHHPAGLLHLGAAQEHVGGVAHEGQGHVVDAVGEAEVQVGPVLLAHGLGPEAHAGQVDALVLLEHPALDHLAAHLHPVGGEHPQLDEAVVHQQPVARAHVLGQVRVGGRHLAGVPQHLGAGGESDGGPRLQEHAHLAGGQRPGADLGPLQVLQHRQGLPQPARGGPHLVEGEGVVLGASVGEVQAGHVCAQLEELADGLGIGGGWPQGGDDLGAPHRRSITPHAGRGPALPGPVGRATVPAAWQGTWSGASPSCSRSWTSPRR
jgi:hypothetical protein